MAKQEVDASDLEVAADSLDALALDRATRRKKLLLGGGGLVLALAGGAFILMRAQDAQAEARISEAWSGLSRCMMGPPIEAGESPSRRFRALQLAAMNLPEDMRAPVDKVPWPDRCASLGHATAEALRAAGRADKDKKDLAHYSEALAKALKEKDPDKADLSEVIENTWIEAAEAKVPVVSGFDVAPPPPLSEHLTADALSQVAPLSKTAFPLAAAHTDAHPGLVLRLLIEEKDVSRSPFLCTFTEREVAPRCAPLPEAIAKTHHGLRLLGTADDDSAPLVFAGNRGGDGVFRSDTGDLIESIYAYGGYATKAGQSSVLGWNERKKTLRLTRKAGAEKRDEVTIDPSFRVGNFYYSSQLLWDHVILRGVTKENERRLFALKVPFTGAVGAEVDVGELPEPGLIEGGEDEPMHIAGCRTNEAMVVRVKGDDNDFMSFLLGGRWSQPVSPDITGGTLSCSKGEAVVTRVEPSGGQTAWKTSVAQSRCTSAGCRGVRVKMDELLGTRFDLAPREDLVDAVELDGKLLLVWAAGERGGVRMRLAAPEQMGKSTDSVIYDDLVKDGRVQKLSTLFGLKLFSRQGFAVLLLSTTSGVHALRIEPDGKVTPTAPAWDAP